MNVRRVTRRYGLAVVSAAVLLVLAAGVTAVAQVDGDEVFTGTLNVNSGVLRNVAVGYEPLRPPNDEEIAITWDRSDPSFAERIADLEDRMAELEAPFETLELFVDCSAGDTLGAALAEAQDHPGPVVIAISGVCEENVGITRDDVAIFGFDQSDGIRAAAPSESTIHLSDARGVLFENMTISGGTAGVEAWGGSLNVDNVTVQETSIWGIWGTGSTFSINNSSIVDNSGFGVTARGGFIHIRNSSLSGNDYALNAEMGGTIQGFDLTVTGNWAGAVAGGQGHISLSGSSLEGNTDNGIAIGHAGSVDVGGDSRIANNGQNGVGLGFNSDFNAHEVVIEGNGHAGISANGSSTMELGTDVTIQDNDGDGIVLHDSSYGFTNPYATVQISDNGGYGINFAGPAAIVDAQNGFDMSAITFSGNTNGDTNLP
jgi:hypothetical protein